MSTYTIRMYKEIPARDGVAFHAEILRNGAVIGTVENGGHGGCNDYYFANRDDHARLVFAARKAMPDDADYPEVHDLFVDNLITIFQMNRLRSHAFRFENDPEGTYLTVAGKHPADEVRTQIRTTHAAKNPQYWDKTVSAWIPA